MTYIRTFTEPTVADVTELSLPLLMLCACAGKYSLIISAAGFIPGIGALVTTLSNWMIVTDLFAVSILEPWFEAKGERRNV